MLRQTTSSIASRVLADGAAQHEGVEDVVHTIHVEE
jgi:hypothetical protein